jgi:hypothetical protein
MTEPIGTIQIWQHFQELVLAIQQDINSDVSPTTLETTRKYEEIDTYFQCQMMATSDYSWPPALAGKMRSYITEIHRLLKLVQRDLVFWHHARQPNTKAQRQTEILGKLSTIVQFSRSMIEELHTSDSQVGYSER